MISNIQKPSNKHSLARSIIALQNPKLEVFEVLSAEDVKTVNRLWSVTVAKVRCL
jgi:hypothetical protein